MAGRKNVGLFSSIFEPTSKGTSQGRKPITSTMNKHKRRKRTRANRHKKRDW